MGVKQHDRGIWGILTSQLGTVHPSECTVFQKFMSALLLVQYAHMQFATQNWYSNMHGRQTYGTFDALRLEEDATGALSVSGAELPYMLVGDPERAVMASTAINQQRMLVLSLWRRWVSRRDILIHPPS